MKNNLIPDKNAVLTGESILTRKIKNYSFFALLTIFLFIKPACADTEQAFGKSAITVEYFNAKNDFTLTELSLNSLALKPLESVKELIATESKSEYVGIKLDHWIRPYFNVFGSLGQTKGGISVKFSDIPGVVVSDMKINTNGILYNVGATAVARNKDYFTSLTYVHSISEVDGNEENTVVNTLVPAIGKKTDIGVFSLGLNYQQLDGKYKGKLAVPFVGNVDAEITAENKNELAYVLGYQTKAAKNIFLRADAVFGGLKSYKLDLSYRF